MDATNGTHKPHKTDVSHAPDGDADDTVLERGCRWVIDAALAACVFAVPCLLGGRIALGQCVLAVSAAVAALAWSIRVLSSRRPTWTVTWVEPLLLAIVGVGLLQITPLPPGLLRLVSPQHAKLLPSWSGDAEAAGSLGTWQTLSLNVGESRQALIVGLSYIALFFVATQRLRRVDDIERLLKWIGASAGLMALFGIVQWLTSNGQFYWFYDYPLTTTGHRLKGAFTNRNHFAEFLALGSAPLLWWILKTLEQRSVTANSFGRAEARHNDDTLLGGLLLMLGALVFAALFSLSRGGTVALGVSLIVMLGALFHAGRLSARVVSVLLGISLISGSLFLAFGSEKVVDRLDNWDSDERLAVWDANWQIIRDFPLFGTGLGSHAEACPMYYDPPFGEVEFTHAENSYLQVASECGVLGLSLALLAVACCVKWCWRTIRSRADVRLRVLSAAVSAGLAANLVHALVDYSWFVPGLMVIVILLAACARRLDQMAAVRSAGGSPALSKVDSGEPTTLRASDTRLPRGLGLATAAITVACFAWAIPQLQQLAQGEPHWFAYLRLSLPHKGLAPTTATTASDDPEATEADRAAQFKQRLAALSATVKHDPSRARAQLRLASAYLAAFDHLQQQSDDPMSLSQLRDTALVSQFESVEAMREWLDRAVGKNVKYLDAAARHAKRAVRLCPLQGQAYVHLAELGFLEDLTASPGPALLQQAQLVRPQSATVQFAVGRQQWLDGQVADALESWKFAFHQDKKSQEQILTLLVGNVPAAVILSSLQPDLAALQRLERRYLNDLRPLAEYPVIAKAYAEALKHELTNPECDQPVERLIAASAVYNRLRDTESTAACLRRALEIDRTSFAARKMYGVFLYEQGDYANATEYLNWCAKMAPTDRWLRGLAEDASAKSSSIQPTSSTMTLPRRMP
ncbi:MAG: O-antigen ligase family protein [Planctomycetaceae bacterium]